ncbi:hypothetical protein CEXT_167311 [Caerostris extrusa]|uniref:Uncharacterized protein n=1 Tax=Caerostris extrusa TaxID=172846 RepID=A0AAV4W7Z7_CAEEX|nr:hypothetical protein CEXT_167311 [Caerostris extrusa]
MVTGKCFCINFSKGQGHSIFQKNTFAGPPYGAQYFKGHTVEKRPLFDRDHLRKRHWEAGDYEPDEKGDVKALAGPVPFHTHGVLAQGRSFPNRVVFFV